jgi:hypothetical protein
MRNEIRGSEIVLVIEELENRKECSLDDSFNEGLDHAISQLERLLSV